MVPFKGTVTDHQAGRPLSRLGQEVTMNRLSIVVSLAILFVFGISQAAYPWGYATHAMVADKINKPNGARNLNEIYGAMTPDMFNFSFGLPVYEPNGLYEQFHYGFMKVWNQRKNGMEKGLALGFVSHNDLWGADWTAHHGGLTYGVGEGYIIAKALILGQVAPLPPELGIPEEIAFELYHTFVEYGLDVLTARIDPTIGWKISTAAVMRDEGFASLLIDAYAVDLSPFFGSPEAAAAFVTYAEQEFRNTMILYGQILMLDEPLAINSLSQYLAGFATSYLSLYGVVLPPEMDVAAVIESYLFAAMDRCQGDYPDEVRATVDYLDNSLAARGIDNSQYHGE
jgi:hypothetical protein